MLLPLLLLRVPVAAAAAVAATASATGAASALFLRTPLASGDFPALLSNTAAFAVPLPDPAQQHPALEGAAVSCPAQISEVQIQALVVPSAAESRVSQLVAPVYNVEHLFDCLCSLLVRLCSGFVVLFLGRKSAVQFARRCLLRCQLKLVKLMKKIKLIKVT